MQPIFDSALVTRRKARADIAAHDFLYAEMAHRLIDRLGDMARGFPDALNLSGDGGVLARMLAGHGGIERMESRVLEEKALPFAADRFDLVLSNAALHWVNNVPGVLMELHRVLKPDGLLLALFPGGETLHELREAMTHASILEEGGAGPRISPFIDVRDAGALLQQAGFALPVVDADRVTVRYENALALMQDLRGMGEANALIARPKRFLRRGTLAAIDEHYRRHFASEDGRIPASFDLITLTGWKPHPSQQQPSKRGSGKVNLGDVLRD